MKKAYDVLLFAAAHRQPVAAVYDDLPRVFCPYVLGRKSGRLRALCYQVGGGSHRGLANAAGFGWRCIAVDKLSQVELCGGAWHTVPRSESQTCVDDIDYDVAAQPEDPQNGQ